ncbi:MAG TPA: hypothetical protein VI564_08320 [Candidatus Nanoarchaeia archaeon]|nr:hypothetical protein [Candidatus Nanoarchaeia archaeon]
MAIFQLGLIGVLNPGILLGVGGVVVVGFLGFMAFRYSSNRAADIGGRQEYSTVKEGGGGLLSVYRYIRGLQRRQKQNISGANNVLQFERREERSVKGNKAETKGVESVEEGAKAALHEGKSEETAAAAEGRVIGAGAAALKIVRAIRDYSIKERGVVVTEEQEVEVLKQIFDKIKNTIKDKVIDARINVYFQEYVGNLVSKTNLEVMAESNKKGMIGELVQKLEGAIDQMKDSIGKAEGRDLKILRIENRKERKHRRSQITKFKKSISIKLKSLKKIKNTRNADPSLLTSRKKEMILLIRQYRMVKSLGQQLDATYAFMKLELKKMKTIRAYIMNNEKSMKKHKKTMEGKKKTVIKKVAELKTASENIAKVREKFRLANPHEAALSISEALQVYFNVYLRIIEEDLSFDNTVREVLIKNFVMEQQLDALEKMIDAFQKSQKAVDEGLIAITQLIEGIVGEGSRVNASALIKELQSQMKYIGYEESINQYMQKLASAVKSNSKQVDTVMQDLIEKDKKLMEEIRQGQLSNSQHIGRVMATAVNRKIQVNENYFKQSEIFEQELKKRDSDAAAAYNQALNAEKLSAAA